MSIPPTIISFTDVCHLAHGARTARLDALPNTVLIVPSRPVALVGVMVQGGDDWSSLYVTMDHGDASATNMSSSFPRADGCYQPVRLPIKEIFSYYCDSVAEQRVTLFFELAPLVVPNQCGPVPPPFSSPSSANPSRSMGGTKLTSRKE